MYLKIFLFVFFYLLTFNSIGQSLLLSNLDFPNEPAIAYNPKNPKQIIVGSAIGQVFISNDEGKNFEKISLDNEYGLWSDPSVFFDEKGSVYYFHLSGTTKGNSSDRIICQVKERKETSFKVVNTIAQTTTKFACNERPIAVYNYNKKEIYLTYVVFDAYGSQNPTDSTRLYFTKSTDYGQNWSTPIRLSSLAGDCSDMDKSVQGATVTFNDNNEIFVAWGNNEKIYLNKSKDGGKTWLKKENLIALQPGGWDFKVPGIKMPNGLPVIVADRSKNEKTSGNLYTFWADQRIKNNISNVYLSQSSDSGKTWSEPRRVAACPFNTYQYHVWVDVDQKTGNVVVSFYQTESDKKTHLMLAVSTNGGKNFKLQTVNEPEFIAEGEQYLGDMNQLACYNNQIFVPIIKAISEKNELFFTKINLEK